MADLLLGFSFIVMLYCSLLWLAVYAGHRRGLHANPVAKQLPAVTFIVPAYNEERNIAATIRGLLDLDYPRRLLRFIVVDDGSTDRTADVAAAFKAEGVTVLRKPNGGKATAINMALKHVSTELVACMDADSWPDKDYLWRAVGWFNDPKVAAVTPAMKVAEPRTIVQKMQWVEYSFSIFLRKLFAIADCQYVVPGPGGLYRTAVLKDIGGFAEGNITEDMEIAFRLHDRGWRLENAANAHVFTHSPSSFRGLFRQRVRWYRGYLRNVRTYSHMIFNRRYGNLGMFLLPINFIWIFLLGFLFLWPVWIWAQQLQTGLAALAAVNWHILWPQFRQTLLYMDFYTFFWALFWALNIATIILSVRMAGEQLRLWHRKGHYLAFMFLYPLVLFVFWFAALGAELVGARARW